jgi:hypothetical protein
MSDHNQPPDDGYIVGSQIFILGGSISGSNGPSGNSSGTITITSVPINIDTLTFPSGQWITYTVPGGQVVCDPEDPSVEEPDDKGHNCKSCKEFFPYAVKNQLDGTMICYACRHGL